MVADERVDLLTSKSQLGQNQTHEIWKQEMERYQFQVDSLQAKLMVVKACIQGSEEDSKLKSEAL